MNVYRFLGAHTEIGGVGVLDSLGQSVKLEPTVALEVMRGGCVMIPDVEYQKLGFNKEDEQAYRYAGTRGTAPPSFKAKLTAALAVYQKLIDEAAMAELLPPESVPAVAPSGSATGNNTPDNAKTTEEQQ